MKKQSTNNILDTVILAVTLVVSLFPVYVLLTKQENLTFLLTGGDNADTSGLLSNPLIIYALVGGIGVGYYVTRLFKEHEFWSKVLIIVPVAFIATILLYVLYFFVGLSGWPN